MGQLLDEGLVGAVLDGLHAGVAGGFEVFEFVVDEEDVEGGEAEAVGCMAVDGEVWLGGREPVGPGDVLEVSEPGVFADYAKFHLVGHIGEDAGGDAGALEALGPLGHGEVEIGPEVGVGVVEVGEVLVGGHREAELGGDELPVGGAFEVPAVVVVAVFPVAGMELVLVEGGEGAEAGPGLRVGRGGEDHAVIEEDGADGGTPSSPRTFVKSLQNIPFKSGLRSFCAHGPDRIGTQALIDFGLSIVRGGSGLLRQRSAASGGLG